MINQRKLKEMDARWKEVMDLAERYGFIAQAAGGTAILLTHKNQVEADGEEKYLYRQREVFGIGMEDKEAKMIDERKLIAKLEDMAKESRETVGLKAPALLEKVMEEVRQQAVNEEIRQRIEREDASSAWIPVSERLPKNDRFVLVTVRGVSRPHTDVDNYEPNYETWNTYDADGEVIAWMPLPEPYKGGSEAK